MSFLSCFVMLCLFVDALWSPAWKGLTSWLSFVMSICDVVTFPLVSWVRCGACLYQFLICAPLSYFVSLLFKLKSSVIVTPRFLILSTF